MKLRALHKKLQLFAVKYVGILRVFLAINHYLLFKDPCKFRKSFNYRTENSISNIIFLICQQLGVFACTSGIFARTLAE